jgi:hypothetical protein
MLLSNLAAWILGCGHIRVSGAWCLGTAAPDVSSAVEAFTKGEETLISTCVALGHSFPIGQLTTRSS